MWVTGQERGVQGALLRGREGATKGLQGEEGRGREGWSCSIKCTFSVL